MSNRIISTQKGHLTESNNKGFYNEPTNKVTIKQTKQAFPLSKEWDKGIYFLLLCLTAWLEKYDERNKRTKG